MDIRQLTSRLDRIENNRLYEGLTLTEVKSVKLWENAGRLIKEAALTPDQVQQLFTSIEQGATAAGGNRTMIGKGKDAASAVNKAWEDLKTKVQNSAPIANVDSAYDSAVAKIEAGLGGPDNAVNQVIQKYRAFAKAHPIAQGLIYSALIAAAGISGAGLGGAAVLGLLKMTDKLLQGEKFSSAAYSGAKTGAMAYGASQLAQHLKGGDNAGNSGPHPKGDTAAGGTDSSSYSHTVGEINPKTGQQLYSINQDGTYDYGPPGLSDDQWLDLKNQARHQLSGGGVNAQDAADASHRGAASGDMKPGDYQNMPKGYNQQAYDEYLKSHPPIGNSIQAKMIAKDMAMRHARGLKEGVQLSERQLATLFTLIQIKNRQVNEGMWDSIKGAAGKAAGAVADKASTIGKNLTTKITADKLNSAWKKAGSPTDSEQVAQVLQGAGADPALVSKAFTDLGIPAPTGEIQDPPMSKDDKAAPGTDPAAAGQPDELDAVKKNAGLPTVNTKDLLVQIMALAPKDQQQVLAYLKK